MVTLDKTSQHGPMIRRFIKNISSRERSALSACEYVRPLRAVNMSKVKCCQYHREQNGRTSNKEMTEHVPAIHYTETTNICNSIGFYQRQTDMARFIYATDICADRCEVRTCKQRKRQEKEERDRAKTDKTYTWLDTLPSHTAILPVAHQGSQTRTVPQVSPRRELDTVTPTHLANDGLGHELGHGNGGGTGLRG